MDTIKKLGIWMDHASAHLMEFSSGPIKTNVITSRFTSQEKGNSLGKSEHLMHNQEQQMHAEYYKKVGEAIRNYKMVLIFGPTQAKQELVNLLKADHKFSNIQIEVKSADRMTEPQAHAFVRDYFDGDKEENKQENYIQ
ncbi:MAG: hypothetical protein SH818_19860 [Saprospiraceae bacterium]|nr:hypothetical protein [Saprospiraceae bacterium]